MSRVTEMNADEGFLSGAAPGSVRRAGVAAAERCTIPDAFKGKFVDISFYDFAAPTNGCAVRFGDGTVAVDLTTVTVRTVEALATNGTTEPHVVLGHLRTVRKKIDDSFTSFSHIASAATGFLVIALSTGDGT